MKEKIKSYVVAVSRCDVEEVVGDGRAALRRLLVQSHLLHHWLQQVNPSGHCYSKGQKKAQ